MTTTGAGVDAGGMRLVGAAAAMEAQARAHYFDRDFPAAMAAWERAYAACRSEGDAAGAARMARTLAGMHGQIAGDQAVSNGWLARAKTLLGTAGDSVEAGWVALNTAMFEADRDRKHAVLRDAVEVARRHGDND